IPERRLMYTLDILENESIRIIREAVAQAERPAMLYSIGKDSSVMLQLALKAFYPLQPPFPLVHVDTTWKFRQMITFRDETVARLGLELIPIPIGRGLTTVFPRLPTAVKSIRM